MHLITKSPNAASPEVPYIRQRQLIFLPEEKESIGKSSKLRFHSEMAFLLRWLLLSLFLYSILLVRCDDEEDNLFQAINQYRTSLNLTALTKNDRAECLSSKVADQFKDQPCTNSTGSNTVPGTEPQYTDFPNLLTKCQLNATTTRDGQIMPACVPNLDPSLVVSNFTKSQYTRYLNDSTFTGVGIGSEGNWIVVVLTTSTPEGSFSVGTNLNIDSGASSLASISHLVALFAAFLVLHRVELITRG